MVWMLFFPSRRRHTRYWRDWSSDVCSSDLAGRPLEPPARDDRQRPDRGRVHAGGAAPLYERPAGGLESIRCRGGGIRKAACRVRGVISGGGVSLKKKSQDFMSV